MAKRYWITTRREVTEVEFVEAELKAGLHRNDGTSGVATAGFSHIDGDGEVTGDITDDSAPEPFGEG